MDNHNQKTPISEMLQKCTSTSDAERHEGWKLLIGRYRNLIYKTGIRKFEDWSFKQKGLQFLDVEVDFINQFFITLFEDECRVLKGFNAVHSDIAFMCFIRTIAERVAKRIFVSYFGQRVATDNLEHVPDTSQPSFAHQQFFEELGSMLRKKSGKLDRNLERDILIFNLYAFHDYNKEMIDTHPVFKQYGHRVYDNVLTRSKEKLRQSGKNSITN